MPRAYELEQSSEAIREDRLCSFCQNSFRPGETVVSCPACGAVHHTKCWSENGNKCAILNCAGSGPIEESPIVINAVAAPSVVTIDLLESSRVLGVLQNGAITLAARQWFPNWSRRWRFLVALTIDALVLGLYYIALTADCWWIAITVNIVYGLVAVFTWQVPDGKLKHCLSRIGWAGLPLAVVLFGALGPIFDCLRSVYCLLRGNYDDS